MSVDDGMQWRTKFTNVVLVNNRLWPNDTEITVSFQPQSDDPETQNLTFEKYKYVLFKILQNSVFIESDQKIYDLFSKFNDKVIDFANKPVDQIIGVTMFSKLQHIGGDCLKINQIDIESWQGENLKFIINENAPEWELIDQQNQYCWWTDDQPNFSSFSKDRLTWNDLGYTITDSKRFTVIKGGTK